MEWFFRDFKIERSSEEERPPGRYKKQFKDQVQLQLELEIVKSVQVFRSRVHERFTFQFSSLVRKA